MKTITIDGQDYVPASQPVAGTRRIVVLDRGWIFVGNLSTENGVSTLTNCCNLRRWKSGGFGGATRDPKGSGVEVDDCEDIVFAEEAPLFIVPVEDDWNV